MRSRVLLLILLVLAAGAAAAWYSGLLSTPHAAPPQGRRAAIEGGKVPVVAGTVIRRDVPIFIDGLGTVQAFNTVTVRARVDGELQKIGFTEGQEVKQG